MRIIAGSAKGVRLQTPEGMDTRPTAERVKEALFSILQFELPGMRVLDLFGGTGQLGLEALSRGASNATFVDCSKDACAVIKENIKRTNMQNVSRVVCCDYASFLKNPSEKYDLIFLDPPYAEKFLENAIKSISEIDILQTGGIIVSERPVGKLLSAEPEGCTRSKDYKYGKTVITLFRKG